MDIQVTRLQTTKVEKGDDSRIVGLARIVINNAFAIGDLRIIERKDKNGYFVAFPSRKTGDGKFVDICHPIDLKTRELIEETILEDFFKEDKEQQIDLGDTNE